jgi:2-polyprenyl-6-methoxyphenol hydroxylase-like FAD-dependent oxidoreductase
MIDGPDVLVVGAGPTGLTLALQACAHGADVRIIERRSEEFRPSRALIAHPRTLEVLRPLGVTDELLARADSAPRVCLHLGTRRVPVALAELDLPDTAFPHLTMIRQADVEAVLTHALAARGVQVDRSTELVDVGVASDDPRVRLRTPAGEEDLACPVVVGCDGAESLVRTGLGIGWPGGTYRREVVLADLDLAPGDDGPEPGSAHVVAGRDGLLFLFALGEGAAWRLLATRPVGPELPSPGRTGPAVPEDQLQELLVRSGLSATITRVAWSSRVRLQHRIADRFRRGNFFLAGDAAHTSSPAGGTGMNTGIQDAANLGWKLALAASSGDPETLLGSYESERRPVAQQVLALTHLIFWAESSTDPAATFLRGAVAPRLAPVVPWALRRRRLMADGVRLLSQLNTGYRRSPLSVDGEPTGHGPRAGDRLPDGPVRCDGRRVRLHELLARPGVHLLLGRDAIAPALPTPAPNLHVHRLTSTPGAGAVVVRPDGYVGFTSRRSDGAGLRHWLDRFAGTSPARAAESAPAPGRVTVR